MTAKLSIIIPVYNGAAFVGRAIDSVLKQTVKADEIVVVNDGSRDNTSEVLAGYGDRIRVISIPNGGVSNARNTGIRASSGDFVAFLDADDVWQPNKLEVQLAALQQYPEVGFTCCNYSFLQQGEKVATHFARFSGYEGFQFDRPLERSPLELLIRLNFVGTCSNVMIRRQVLDEVGLFDTGYRQSEDYDLWLRCATATRFLLTSEVLLEKKSHDSNLTNDFLETLVYHEQVLVNLPERYPAAGKQIMKIQATYREALARLRYQIGNLYYETGGVAKAFGYFLRGLKTDLSARNVKLFAFYSSRKVLRMLSFGILRKPQRE